MRLTFHNLKKAKGQFFSFGIMILLTALVMHIALVLGFQTSDAYDSAFAELDTAEINVFVPAAFGGDAVAERIEKINGVARTEKHAGVYLTATVREFAGSDFDMNTVFYRVDDPRTLDRLEVDGALREESDVIYIPAYVAQLGGFSVGERITYRIDGEDLVFTVGGTVKEMQYGNYGTGLIGAYLTGAAFDAFCERFADRSIAEYAVKTADGADLNEVKKEITATLGEANVPLVGVADCASAKETRTMVSSLLILIFLALAAIILLVGLFLSGFRIRNSMEDEMTNMGVLKAIGYTSGGIMTGVVTPYTLVGAIFAALGIGVSYALLPPVAQFLAMQSGFSYTPHFDIGAFLLSLLLPTLLIFLFSVLAAKRIRKLEPIHAIRGIGAGKATKNRFPLEGAKAGVKPTIVLKQIFSSGAQNVLLFVLSFGIMILLSFAGTLFYNVNIKPDNFMNTLSEETPSVVFTAKAGQKEELKTALLKEEEVSLVLEYASASVGYADGSLTCFVCEDFSKVTNDICYEGANPAAADEVALGSALADRYRIGDTIEITNGVKKKTYTVTGYIQSVNNGGAVCELTTAGFEKIGDGEVLTLNVYLKKGRAEAFIEEWEAAHGGEIESSLNYEKLNENGQKMYAGIVSAVTALLFLISVLVVLLVMYIMIGSMITRRKQEFGIYKAIGWSNRQLVTQTAMCFVPVIALSAVLSALAGLFYMPAINNVIFGLLGAMKNHFEVSLWFLLLFAALLVAAAFLICVLLARPIKKITAYSLLKE